MKNLIFSIWQVTTVGVGNYAFYFNIFAYTICLGLCFWIYYEWSGIGSFLALRLATMGLALVSFLYILFGNLLDLLRNGLAMEFFFGFEMGNYGLSLSDSKNNSLRPRVRSKPG